MQMNSEQDRSILNLDRENKNLKQILEKLEFQNKSDHK
jgi:hypothetical protein